jgi:hypothetical protein
MEELQDAIEDAQYMNAMHDGIPRPTQDWRWPSTEEFKDYLEKVGRNDSISIVKIIISSLRYLY